MQILRKLAPQLPLHSLLAPLAPLGFKKIFARFLASISAQIWRNVTKNTKNTDFKKTVPPAAPRLHAPLAPLEIKKKFGRLLTSISAQVLRNITKNSKNADFKKSSPPAAPNYSPPWPPWGSKKFWGGFWHLFMSNPSHLAQKIRQNHQFWSNRCMTPSVAALCIPPPLFCKSLFQISMLDFIADEFVSHCNR